MTTEKDLRIHRTKKAITEAFLSLLEKKSFQQITIQDIADRAMINRSTFYAHYTDKYDLLEKHTEKALSQLEELPHGNYFNQQPDISQYQTIFDKLFEYIADNAVFFKAMYRDLPEFPVRLGNKLMEVILSRLHDDKKNLPYLYQVDINEDLVDEFYARYYSSTCLGIITWWLENDMIYSPGHMSKIYSTVVAMSTYELYGLNTDQTKK